jgi:hypothetical protein
MMLGSAKASKAAMRAFLRAPSRSTRRASYANRALMAPDEDLWARVTLASVFGIWLVLFLGALVYYAVSYEEFRDHFHVSPAAIEALNSVGGFSADTTGSP